MIDTDNAPDTERPANREEYELAACIATAADTMPPEAVEASDPYDIADNNDNGQNDYEGGW